MRRRRRYFLSTVVLLLAYAALHKVGYFDGSLHTSAASSTDYQAMTKVMSTHRGAVASDKPETPTFVMTSNVCQTRALTLVICLEVSRAAFANRTTIR